MRQIYFLLALLALGGLARSARAAAPAITQQPTNQTAQVNHFVTFSVTATGTAPLHYQWLQSGSNSPNATNAFINVTSQTPGSNLNFLVVITNSFGSITSDVAVLTLVPDNEPPSALRATNTPNLTKINVEFSERLSGSTATNAANYAVNQGVTISSAVLQGTGSNVVLTVSTLNPGNTYTLTVSNVTDIVSNLMQPNPTNLTFQAGSKPTLVTQPTNQTTTVGQPVTFSVSAAGIAPLRYQWRRDGSNIGGASGSNYTLAAAQPVDNGAQFLLIVTNNYGMVTSAVATLSVNSDTNPPTLLQLTNTPDFVRIILTFSELMEPTSANDDLNYVLDNGASVLSAVLALDGSHVTLNVSMLTEGVTYTLTTSGLHDLASNLQNPDLGNFAFQAAVFPQINSQPPSLAALFGDPATFSVSASGTPPIFYQWFKGANAIPGATTPTYEIANVQPSSLGSYHCEVANTIGVVTSAVATLMRAETYTLDLPAGYSFISNPLYNPAPTFPNPPDGTLAFKWNVGSQMFGPVFIYDSGNGGWVDGIGTPVAPFTLSLGEGALINLPMPASLSFTGAVVPPILPVALQPGFNLLGVQAPIAGGYAEIVGPPQEGSAIYRYKGGQDPTKIDAQSYAISYFRNGMWNDSPPPVLGIAQAGFFSLVTPVVITTQPAAHTNVSPGQSVSFDISATGTGPLLYQWLLNGTAIPGATNSSYPIQSVNASNAGLYSVTVGNAVGDVSSLEAPLTLNAPFLLMTDNFANQTNVNDFNRLLSSHNRNATMQTNEPAHGGKRSGGSVWLTWTAPASGVVTFSTAGSGFDTILAAYRGTNVANLLLMDADDDGAGYACSRIRFNAQQGVPYRICVAGLGAERGDILLGWFLEVTTAVVPEIGAQPQDQTVGYGDTAQFTVTATNGNFSYQWYRDGAAINGATLSTLTINNAGDDDVGSYYVHVYNAGNTARFRDSLSASLQIEVPEPGQPLTGARVSGKFFDLIIPGGGGSGTPLKGPSPKLGGTVAHGYSGAQTFSTVGLGKDPGEPNHCGIAGGNSVWYAIQATNNGTMYINTDGSSFNTVMAAYIGPGVDFITLTNVACDNNSGLDGLDSSTSFAATSGTIYYIAVDGVGAASGTVKFHYHLVLPLTLTNLVYSTNASGSFTMKVITTPSLTNIIHYRTNLTSTNWVAVLTNTSSTGSFNYTNTGVGAITNRFYRALNKF